MKKTLGEVITETRKSKNMTQLELAEKMGVTDKAVSKWERNLSCPDINSIPLLAEVLGISVNELMQIKTASKEPDKPNFHSIFDIALKGVGMAMGIAVAVLSMLNELDVQSGMGMLGIGLACLAISMLSNNEKK